MTLLKTAFGKTAFGRRHGWEIQHFMLGPRHFWRLTGKTWCRGATHYELKLWRLLKKLDPEQFKVRIASNLEGK